MIRALGREVVNPIMAFHRASFFPSIERAPHHTYHRIPLRAVVLGLRSAPRGSEQDVPLKILD